MSEYFSDKEQIEMIKNWWKENGKFTIFSIVAALVLSAGWRYWQKTKNETAANASMQYEQMLVHEGNHQLSEAEMDATSIMTSYPKTPYATLAAFISAQNAIKNNHIDVALEKFNWVILHTKNKDFKQIAKIRQARVLLALEKYDEALKALEHIDAQAYLPLINETKGDIYFSKGDKKAARISYQNAVNGLRKDSPNRALLQMKNDQLGSE